MQWFKSACVVVTLCALVVSTSLSETRHTPQPQDEPRIQPFVFFAVLEGLYQLGLNDPVVDRILQSDPRSGYPASFIYACPICMPAYDAFNAYRRRPVFIAAKSPVRDFGAGPTAELEQQLASDDLKVRTPAIGKLVERFVRQRIAEARWTGAERARWEKALTLGRKKGEEMLRQFQGRGSSSIPPLTGDGSRAHPYMNMNSCSMCDGVTAACKAR